MFRYVVRVVSVAQCKTTPQSVGISRCKTKQQTFPARWHRPDSQMYVTIPVDRVKQERDLDGFRPFQWVDHPS